MILLEFSYFMSWENIIGGRDRSKRECCLGNSGYYALYTSLYSVYYALYTSLDIMHYTFHWILCIIHFTGYYALYTSLDVMHYTLHWILCIIPVLWIRNDLFQIRIKLWIFRVPNPDPDPGKSSRSMRIQIRIQPILISIIQKNTKTPLKFNQKEES